MPEQKTFNYSLANILVSFGTIVINEASRDGFITIVPKADLWNSKVHGRGTGTRSQVLNFGYDITLVLPQASPINALLSAAAEADRLTGGGAAPFLVKSARGSSLFKSEQVWIKRLPDMDFQNDDQDRTWTLECTSGTMFHGTSVPLV